MKDKHTYRERERESCAFSLLTACKCAVVASYATVQDKGATIGLRIVLSVFVVKLCR